MDDRGIGIFDSGLGGLTTLKELHRLLPNERLIYFGDTGRVPYGTRGSAIIRKYASQDANFLKSFDVKLIVAACGTVSSNWTPEMTRSLGLPFSGVLGPAVRAACGATQNGHIAVIGTSATIHSGAFEREIRKILPDAQITPAACPLFVPLVENGFLSPDDEITTLVAKRYLAPIAESGADTLILGCTHYPLIRAVIDKVLDGRLRLIDPGLQTARWAKDYLTCEGMLRSPDAPEGGCTFYVSDTVETFNATAALFLGENITGRVKQVDLQAGAFAESDAQPVIGII